jgi:hypothetical protein
MQKCLIDPWPTCGHASGGAGDVPHDKEASPPDLGADDAAQDLQGGVHGAGR